MVCIVSFFSKVRLNIIFSVGWAVEYPLIKDLSKVFVNQRKYNKLSRFSLNKYQTL